MGNRRQSVVPTGRFYQSPGQVRASFASLDAARVRQPYAGSHEVAAPNERALSSARFRNRIRATRVGLGPSRWDSREHTNLATQGTAKARETRLVSPLGFDGAVPSGRIQTRRQSSVPKTNTDPATIISPEDEFRPGANHQSRRRIRTPAPIISPGGECGPGGNHQSRRDVPIKARGKARRASRALTQSRVRSLGFSVACDATDRVTADRPSQHDGGRFGDTHNLDRVDRRTCVIAYRRNCGERKTVT